MKKIIILLSLFILFSCSKETDVSWEVELDNTLNQIEQDIIVWDNEKNEIPKPQSEQWSEKQKQESIKNELEEITHSNFKPLIEWLKWFDKETLKTIECESYLYFPELDKRPDYQVEIYRDYLKQCEDIKLGN